MVTAKPMARSVQHEITKKIAHSDTQVSNLTNSKIPANREKDEIAISVCNKAK